MPTADEEGGALAEGQYVDPFKQTQLLLKLANMMDDASIFFDDNIKPYTYFMSNAQIQMLQKVALNLEKVLQHFKELKFQSNVRTPYEHILYSHEEGNGRDIVQNFEDALDTLLITINSAIPPVSSSNA